MSNHTPIVKFKRVALSAEDRERTIIPTYATPGSSGMDLCCLYDFGIHSNSSKLVSTGLAIELPQGYEAQVRPRSGLALKHKVTVLNTPGTIDADYRGELKVLLFNHGNDKLPARFKAGDRIAQLVIVPVAQAEILEVDELSETSRGEGGFGSTGS